MARYNYNVNTASKYIDVHKQFNGGLKTVDTDDALGAVYLRDAENVSLSEFGFIEKRYGTYENFIANLSMIDGVNGIGKLQGYWEMGGKYIIIAFAGNLYWQLLSSPTNAFNKFTTYYISPETRFPNFNTEFSWVNTGTGTEEVEGDFAPYLRFIGVSFQKTREMGAVNLSNVLYVFTGTYPVYIFESEGENFPRALLFSSDAPSYDEIVVAGHNLLESDYQSLYFDKEFTTAEVTDLKLAIEPLTPEYVNGKETYPDLELPKKDLLNIKTSKTKPLFSNTEDDTLKFLFSYKYSQKLSTEFYPTEGKNFLNKTSLTNISYRPSGPGATDLEFKDLISNSYSSVGLDNIERDLENFNILTENFYEGDSNVPNDSVLFTTSNLTTEVIESESSTTYAITPNFWQAVYEPGTFGENVNVFGVKLNQKTTETGAFTGISVEKETLEASIEVTRAFLYDDASETINEENKKFAINLTQNGNQLPLEEKKEFVQNFVSELYDTLDSAEGTEFYVKTVIPIDSTIGDDEYKGLFFRKYYTTQELILGQTVTLKNTISEIPVFVYSNYENDMSDVEFSFTEFDDNLYVTVVDDGTVEYDNYLVEYEKQDGTSEDLKVSYFRYAYPQALDEQEIRDAILQVPDTYITFVAKDSQGTEIESSWEPKFYVNTDNLTYDAENKAYIVTLPDTFSPPSAAQKIDIKIVLNTFNIASQTVAGYNDDYKALEVTDVVGERNFVNGVVTESVIDYIMQGVGQTDKDYYFYSDFNSLPTFVAPSFNELDLSTNDGTMSLLGVIQEVEDSEGGNYGTDLISVDIFKGLLSGLYDFKFDFKTTQWLYTEGSVTSVVKDSTHSFIQNNVRIVYDEFEDLPGTDDVALKAHPMWSCTNVIEHFNKLMVWGSLEMPTALFYSFPDRPFYFPSKFYLDFTNDKNEPLISVAPYMNILVAQTEEMTWGIRGNSGLIEAPAPYTPFIVNPSVGTIARKSVRPVRNHLFFLSKQGIVALKSLFAADEQYNIDFVDRNIANIVSQDVNAVGIQFDNQYWLNFPETGITLRYYIDKKAWVLDTYGAWDYFKGVFKWQINNGKLEFITYPSVFGTLLDANEDDVPDNLGIYKIGVDYSLPTDLSGGVTAKMETSFLNQNYPFHPKNYKEAKLDFTLQNEYNLSKDALAVYPHGVGDEELEIDIETEGQYSISSVPLIKNHRYRLTWVSNTEFDNLQNVSITIGEEDVPQSANGTNYIEFLLDNNTDGDLDIVFGTVPTLGENDELDLRDVTYDNELNFLIQVVSENSILNQDLYEGYDTPQFDVDISLKDRLGDWKFGETDFGKKVTAVDTIKLSGRGYNSKIYFEDTSKSKWTLESIGITYKMKRARSR